MAAPADDLQPSDDLAALSFETLSDGWAFPECPRWHDGALWFSDIYGGQVVRLDVATGDADVVLDYDGHPSGLGFLPDGRLLVVDGLTRTVLRREDDGTVVTHADLTAVAEHTLNDMHVDRHGRAYVGNYGDASAPPEPPFAATLALVSPDGEPSAAAAGLLFANGMDTVDDGVTLLVAETRATPGRLSAFTIGPDGALSQRRTHVAFAGGVLPDGIAATPDGDVWVASPFTDQLLHVSPDGSRVRSVAVPHPYAVAVGGTDGDTLFVCSSPSWQPEAALRERGGRILIARR